MFEQSEELQELASVVRDVLRQRADSLAVRRATETEAGFDTELWALLCEQVGVASLAIPEEYGGAGATLLETHAVLEALGATMAPSPLLGSGVLAAQALLRSGNAGACERLLPGIAEGRVVSLAWAGEHGWRTDGSPVAADAAGRLTGASHLVLDAASAEVFLVVATIEGGGLGLYELPATGSGVRITPVPAMDTTLQLGTLVLDRAPATPLTDDAAPMLQSLYDVAATAVTALQVGGAQRALDLTVEYSKTRVQFGRPIGSFQALKHRMADMLVAIERARSTSWAAASAAAHDEPGLARQAAIAKAVCSAAFNEVAGEAVQLHGGVAITWEHDAQMLFKRAHATSQLFGQPHEHRHRLVELLGVTA